LDPEAGPRLGSAVNNLVKETRRLTLLKPRQQTLRTKGKPPGKVREAFLLMEDRTRSEKWKRRKK
jgi:hypothetical protein